MPEDEVVWKIDKHTLAKHEILRRYLEAWLPIMSSWCPRLVIIDGFAGPGVYKGGEPGSPIVELQTFLTHKQRDRIRAEVVCVFIEEDVRRAERLEQEIARFGKLPSQLRVRVIPGKYEETFSRILDEIQEQGASLAPTFAFIDPFGYSQAPMHLSGRFLQFERCEVLLYAPLRWINRFISRAGQETALTSFFGTDRWKDAIPLYRQTRIRFLHDLLYEQLKAETGLRYVRSFEIVAPGNHGYHLFSEPTTKRRDYAG